MINWRQFTTGDIQSRLGMFQQHMARGGLGAEDAFRMLDVIHTELDDPSALLAGGRLLERVWLEATRLELGFQVILQFLHLLLQRIAAFDKFIGFLDQLLIALKKMFHL